MRHEKRRERERKEAKKSRQTSIAFDENILHHYFSIFHIFTFTELEMIGNESLLLAKRFKGTQLKLLRNCHIFFSIALNGVFDR